MGAGARCTHQIVNFLDVQLTVVEQQAEVLTELQAHIHNGGADPKQRQAVCALT